VGSSCRICARVGSSKDLHYRSGAEREGSCTDTPLGFEHSKQAVEVGGSARNVHAELVSTTPVDAVIRLSTLYKIAILISAACL